LDRGGPGAGLRPLAPSGVKIAYRSNRSHFLNRIPQSQQGRRGEGRGERSRGEGRGGGA